MALEELSELETFIDNESKDFLMELDCCGAEFYRNQQKFKFLPGHARLILKLPNQIEQMQQQTGVHNNKKKASKPSIFVEPTSSAPQKKTKTTSSSLINASPFIIQPPSSVHESNRSIASTSSTSPSELLSNSTMSENDAIHELNSNASRNDNNNQEIVDTEDQYLNELLAKLWRIGKDKNLQFMLRINAKSVHYCSYADNNVFKCDVKCPLCSKKFFVTYDKHWQTSNIVKHFTNCGAKNQPLDADLETNQEHMTKTIGMIITSLASPTT